MGEIPGGFQIGDTCNICVGVIFEQARTPAYIAVRFTGIEKLIPELPDPPNNLQFILIEAAYCYWWVHVIIGLYHCQAWVFLSWPGEKTHICAKWTGYPDAFFFEHYNDEPCIIEGNSRLPIIGDGARNGYSGGFGKITWGPAINEAAFKEQNLGLM